MADDNAETLPAAVTKAYDLLLWLIDHVDKFPPYHRSRSAIGSKLADELESVRAEPVEA